MLHAPHPCCVFSIVYLLDIVRYSTCSKVGIWRYDQPLVRISNNGLQNPSKITITGLSVVYKPLRSLLCNKICEYCEKNNIIAFEQKCWIRKSLSCKEQFTIDIVNLKQAERKSAVGIYTCYIEYAKALDSVTYNWLLKTLEIYNFSGKI